MGSFLGEAPPAPARWRQAVLAVGLLVLLAASPWAEAAAREAQSRKPAAQAPAKGKASARITPKSRAAAPRGRASVVRVAPARPSFGQVFGLHATDDPLDLKSSVALVVDQETRQILFSKNPEAVLPIASITKLMTALVVTEAGLPLDEVLTITQDDVDTEKGSRSRLNVGTQLSRGEMLHLALMSSENRAAHALGRHYPGGLDAFVAAMNAKAQQLGMGGTRYVEPTGLSSRNQSSATDLARLVDAAYAHPIIRELSTMPEAQVAIGSRQLQFRNTNGLVRNPEWAIGLQKTGYISEAGRCVVMQAQLAGRKLIMVLLDSAGRYSRIGDAERIRKWLDQGMPFGTALESATVRARP
ncbi:MAG: D-alanyl-D-alanine endopeptidase [Burkholderiales bacterium]|nr:D-alanyl-D-alanine endopeptidase [Burkholderiales bacterium]